MDLRPLRSEKCCNTLYVMRLGEQVESFDGGNLEFSFSCFEEIFDIPSLCMHVARNVDDDARVEIKKLF